jgi:hypothetical protein
MQVEHKRGITSEVGDAAQGRALHTGGKQRQESIEQRSQGITREPFADGDNGKECVSNTTQHQQ